MELKDLDNNNLWENDNDQKILDLMIQNPLAHLLYLEAAVVDFTTKPNMARTWRKRDLIACTKIDTFLGHL